MKMPPALAQWNGADALTKRFEADGFELSKRFVEFTAPIVGETEEVWRRKLIRHAQDFVRHAGKVLDTTSVEQSLASARRALAMDVRVREQYVARHAMWVAAELRPDPALEEGWSDLRVHLRRVAQRVAIEAGFHKTTNGYVVPLPGGLELDVEVESGRPGSQVSQLVTYNKLRATRGRWSMVLPLEVLLPGFAGYRMLSERSALVWAIKANVSAAKAFAYSLE